MDFEDLVKALEPPPNRVRKSEGPHEHHLYEGAVMVAYAMHLLRTQNTQHVRIHPDGEHGKQLDFAGWLLRRGFVKVSSLGSTGYGGIYRNASNQTITVNPKSGLGDVVAEVGNKIVWEARLAEPDTVLQVESEERAWELLESALNGTLPGKSRALRGLCRLALCRSAPARDADRGINLAFHDAGVYGASNHHI